jgi:hypothetical protein
MKTGCRLTALLVVLVVAGCERAATPAAPIAMAKTNAPTFPPGWPATKAQPKLPTMKLLVGPQIVDAEIALKPIELATGMMFRKEMGENEGMLFVLPYPQQASFYMKNTLLPLHVAYIDAKGTILELHELKPLDETPVFSKTDNIHFVLEMNTGWFTRNNITTGTVIRTQVGGLKDAFRFVQ